MNINIKSIEKTASEIEVIESVLSLNHKKILELGCGDASITRLIASSAVDCVITATEVDPIQHQKNLKVVDMSNVNFKLAGCENIPAEDNSFDIVFMFKSLHHVPLELLDKALQEVKRVLKTGGMIYISEPVFDGDFNEILRVFHDEELVRKYAFDAIKKAIDKKELVLVKEIFFYSPVVFNNFRQFEERIIGVTHTEHNLSDDMFLKVKQKFDDFYQKNSGNFTIPNRVDILTK